MKCYSCGEEGHRSSECPKGRGFGAGRQRSRSRSRERDRGIGIKKTVELATEVQKKEDDNVEY